jgi:regulator of RNase E activity RraA
MDTVRLGHHPVIPSRLGERPPDVPGETVEQFRGVAVPDLSDAVGRLYTMDSGIRPLYAGMPRLLGRAVTVKAPPGDNWAVHAGLSRCGEGDILIVDWRGWVEGCGSGALTAVLAMRRGLAGIVVDGAWRDIEDLRQVGLPVMGRGISPFSPAKQELGEVDVPVCCGGVVVEPGDVVIGDAEGVVVVRREWASLVADGVKRSPAMAQVNDEIPEETAARIRATGTRYWDAAGIAPPGGA